MADQVLEPRSARIERKFQAQAGASLLLPRLGRAAQLVGGAPAASHNDPVAEVMDVASNGKFLQSVDSRRPLLGRRGAVTYLDFPDGAELNMPLSLAETFDGTSPFTFFAVVRLAEAPGQWGKILAAMNSFGQADREGVEILLARVGSEYHANMMRWVGHANVSASINNLQPGEFGVFAASFDGQRIYVRWNDQTASAADTRSVDASLINFVTLASGSFVGEVYGAGLLPHAISDAEFAQLRLVGESLIALPPFPLDLPIDFEVAHSSLWSGSGCEVNNLTMFGGVHGMSITSGAEVWHRASRGIPVTNGVTYGFQTFYAAGTSGQIRCEGWANGGAISMRLDGPVGAASVTSEIGGTFSNVQNIDHGNGIYELKFDVILQDQGQGDVNFGIGPNAPNSSVILFGNRMDNYGADLLRFPAYAGLNLLADPEPNASWSGFAASTPLNQNFFGRYAGLRIESVGHDWQGAEINFGNLVAGQRYSAVAYVELGSSGNARLHIRSTGAGNSEEQVLRYISGSVSQYATAAADPATVVHVADVKNVNGNIYRLQMDFTSPKSLANVKLKIGPQSSVAGEDVVGIVAGVFEVHGV